MAEASTVSVRRTWGVPPMVGSPVAGLFGGGATATVAALVRLSWLFASSVKETLTFMVLPSSASTQGVGGVRLTPYLGVIPDPLVQVGVGRVGQPVGVGDTRRVNGQGLAHLGRPADGGTARGPVVLRGRPHVVGVAQDQPCGGGSAVAVAGGDVPEEHPAVDVVGVLRAGDRHGLGRVPVVCGEGQAGGTHRRPARRTLADGHRDVSRRLGRQRHGVCAALAFIDLKVGPAQGKPPVGPFHVGKGGPVGRRLPGEREQIIAI